MFNLKPVHASLSSSIYFYHLALSRGGLVDSVVQGQGKGLGFDSAPFIFQKINISSYFSGLMLLKLSTRALLSRYFVLILRLSIWHSVKNKSSDRESNPEPYTSVVVL